MKKEKSLMPTAPSVPRRSPIQVLTGLNIAWLQWSDENWYVQCDMAVGEKYTKIDPIWPNFFFQLYWMRNSTISRMCHYNIIKYINWLFRIWNYAKMFWREMLWEFILEHLILFEIFVNYSTWADRFSLYSFYCMPCLFV